jgi:hypothetical protein
MAVFHQEDPTTPPVFGVGKGIRLGINDKISWLAPPSAPFDVLAESIDKCREELYRTVHQMADGVSSSASNSAKSAKSKSEDQRATRAILEAYATILRDAIGRIVDLIGALRGDDDASKLSISGLDKFTEIDISDLFDSIEKANEIGMPSDAFQMKERELILDALMPQLSEQSRGIILEELKGGLADLKKKDALEAQYQQALAHAITAEQSKRPGKPADDVGGNGGGSIADAETKAPTKKPSAPGPAKA